QPLHDALPTEPRYASDTARISASSTARAAALVARNSASAASVALRTRPQRSSSNAERPSDTERLSRMPPAGDGMSPPPNAPPAASCERVAYEADSRVCQPSARCPRAAPTAGTVIL